MYSVKVIGTEHMKIFTFFHRSEKSTVSAALILMFSLLVANLLGLLKLRLFANLFGGASSELGVFLAADRIPNFVFNVLAVGALSSSFIPIFSKLIAGGQKERALGFSSSLFNFSILVFLLFTLVFLAFPEIFLGIISWGNLSPNERSLLVDLSKILFLAQIFFILSAFSSGILQSFNQFTSVALSPVVFNLAVIVFSLFFSQKMGIYAAAWGTVLGAFCHFLVQIPALLRVGFSYRFSLNLRDRLFLEIGRIFLPRSLSLVVDQISLLVFTSYALSLSASSVVVYNFAQRIEMIPVVLFGSTFAQASFATLSKNAEIGDSEFLKTFQKTFSYLSFLIIPASVFLVVLRIPLIRIFFGARGFDWNATLLTAYTLSFFALGMFFQAQVALLARSFFALKNSRVPFLASLASLILGLGLGLVFIKVLNFGVWSLGLSESLISALEFLILYLFLKKKFDLLGRGDFIFPVFKIIIAAFVAGLVSYSILRFLDLRGPLFDTRYFVSLFGLTALSLLVGLVVYLTLCYKMGIREGEKVVLLLRKTRNFGPNFLKELFQE